jgi:outer membrane biosynthesis protein TonB
MTKTNAALTISKAVSKAKTNAPAFISLRPTARRFAYAVRTIRTVSSFCLIAAFVLVVVAICVAPAYAQQPSTSPNVQTHNEAVPSELAELTKPTNTALSAQGESQKKLASQWSYVPATINMQELRRHLKYPARALDENVSASFTLLIYLNEKGGIETINVEMLSQPRDFATEELLRAACAAVKQCTFTPAYRNDEAVVSVLALPLKFLL